MVNETPHCFRMYWCNNEAMFSNKNSFVPGPGNYESTECISARGKYYTSKHANSKSKVFDPKSSQRFNKSGKTVNNEVNDIPGPGSYKNL